VKTYRTSDVAELSGLTSAQLRTLARDGSIGHRHGRHYSFQFADLVLARSAQQLLREGCRMATVREALRRFGADPRLGPNRLRVEGRGQVGVPGRHRPGARRGSSIIPQTAPAK